MRFPNRELAIVQLAKDVARGFTENPDLFPAPPAPPEVIDQALAAWDAARNDGIAAAAGARDGMGRKQEALNTLTALLRADVRYAESMANGEGGKLQKIGWAPRRKATRTEPVAPGQVMTLAVRQEGKDWVALGWNAPLDGGPVSAYRIQRRRRQDGDWADVGASVDTAATLPYQETGVELEYRVIGVNQVGEGPLSNVVRVVL